MKQASIQDAGYIKSTISSPNGIWAKSRKYVSPWCSPAPSSVKSNLLVMLVNTSANNLVEFTDVNILFFILLSLLLVPLPSRWYCTIFMWFILRPHYLLYTYLSLIPAFFFFHQVVWKPFNFINNGLRTNQSLVCLVSLVNESNFPSFPSLCVFIFGHRLGKCPNNFCININVNVY